MLQSILDLVFICHGCVQRATDRQKTPGVLFKRLANTIVQWARVRKDQAAPREADTMAWNGTFETKGEYRFRLLCTIWYPWHPSSSYLFLPLHFRFAALFLYSISHFLFHCSQTTYMLCFMCYSTVCMFNCGHFYNTFVYFSAFCQTNKLK